MKYAFMTFSTPQLNLDEVLTMAARLGYDGIEPRIGSGHAHGIELTTTTAQRQAIRAQAADAGVALCCIATSCKYADPATAPQFVDETRQAIALAADLGSPRLRVFGGAFPDSISREAAIEGVAAALRSVADEAQQHGVVLCLETHDAWTDPQHVVAVMQRVAHPAVAVNWDYMHTIRVAKTTVDDAFTKLKPWIQHVHFHDGADSADKLVFLPIGAGDYDNQRVAELLMSAGYEGYLSGEWINWEPGEVHLPRELAAMREIEQRVQAAG